jgi:hypothetical protein
MMALPVRGRLSGVMLAVVLGSCFVMGMMTGGNAVATGEEPVDFYATATEDAFTDDGRLVQDTTTTTEPTVAPFGMDRMVIDADTFELIDTPRVDRAVRQQIAVPMLKLGFRLGDAGYNAGYVLASTAGVWSVKAIGYVWQAAMLGGVAWEMKRRIPA